MKIDAKKTLILVDGSSFLYRAYYGLKPLYTPQGLPVQAVFGFCRMIRKLIDTFNPQNMMLVWDSKGKTIRHQYYPDYKATRQAPPSDLFEQKDLIVKFADLIGLFQCSKEGVEADDLMYSAGLWWKKGGGLVLLVTSDKDMGQMLDSQVIMYDTFKDLFIDKDFFAEKMGFPVEKTAFYFSLLGDASDNIPGVRGIGKKRALDLVIQFDSLLDLYKRIDTVEQQGIKKNLIEQRNNAFLSEKLFTLHKESIIFNKKDVSFDESRWNDAHSFFEKLQFKSFIKKRAVQTSLFVDESSTLLLKKGYIFELVTTLKKLKEVIKEMEEAALFAYDTEGDGLNPLEMKMVGLSLCAREGVSYYIPCGHSTGEEQLSLIDLVHEIKPLFENSSIKKIAHHAKFDKHVLMSHGIKEAGLFFDTMIAASLVKEEWQKNGLKDLSESYLHETMLTYEQVVTLQKRKNFSEVPLSEAVDYAAADAHQTLKLYHVFKKMLIKNGTEKLFYTIEMPILEILFEMEQRGIYCDKQMLVRLGKEVDKQLETICSLITAFIGPHKSDINLNSPRQVADLLFIDLKLKPQRKSNKGAGFSTDYEVLKELTKEHPVPAYVIRYRELYKLKTTYIESLPTFINPKTGRIHTSYSQIRVATGRLASSDPNLQNIPVDTVGFQIRSAFKPQEGHLFLSADYSQIELRVLAHLSGDKKLIQLFKENHDIHAETASAILNIPIDGLTKHDRSIGKRINFSILYGLTPYGLSKDLDISLKDAKQYIEGYFNQYPQVKEWMDSVIKETKEHGYTKTFFGRRRAVSGIYEKNKHLYEEACRIAVNTVVQGTAAELMKMGMMRVDVALKKYAYDAFILLQIHDELLLTVLEADSKRVQKLVEKEMASIVNWEVDFKVNSILGKNWQET